MIAAIFLALLCLASVLLAWIDIHCGIIPDWLNLLIASVGLVQAVLLGGYQGALGVGCEGIVVGAIAWLLRWLYFRFRRIQGLGLGDVKLLAASGVWIGIAGVPMQLLVGSLAALTAACGLHLAGRTMTRQTSLPFGPFLALGLLVTVTLQRAGLIG
jgi:leader peptidase (prepilin peptidase) / N-methyltransferase